MKVIIGLIKEYLLIVYYLFKRIFGRYPESFKVGNKPAIILPGYIENRIFLEDISRFLNENGYSIHAEWGYRTTKSIKYNIDTLANYIKSQQLQDVLLVGHSQGGVVINEFLNEYKKLHNEISKVISISTPHNGSLVALLPFFYMYELRAPHQLTVTIPKSLRYFNLYPSLDNHVIPQSSLISNHPSADNIKVDIIGHTRILRASETLKIIKNHLL